MTIMAAGSSTNWTGSETMKQAVQYFLYALPILGLVLAPNYSKLNADGVNLIFKYINVAFFSIVCIWASIAYAYLVNREALRIPQQCFHLAQLICLLTGFLSFGYAYTTLKWIEVLKSGGKGDAIIDIWYSIVDCIAAVNFFLVLLFICAVIFGRWLLPVGGRSIKMARPIGKILVEEGFLEEKDLTKALKIQQEEEEKRS